MGHPLGFFRPLSNSSAYNGAFRSLTASSKVKTTNCGCEVIGKSAGRRGSILWLFIREILVCCFVLSCVTWSVDTSAETIGQAANLGIAFHSHGSFDWSKMNSRWTEKEMRTEMSMETFDAFLTRSYLVRRFSYWHFVPTSHLKYKWKWKYENLIILLVNEYFSLCFHLESVIRIS